MVVVVMEVEVAEEVEEAGAVEEEGVDVVAVEEADQVGVAAMEVEEAVEPMTGKVVSFVFSIPRAGSCRLVCRAHDVEIKQTREKWLRPL